MSFGMKGPDFSNLSLQPDPTGFIIDFLLKNKKQKIKLKDLQEKLVEIERWEVVEDTEELFGK